eukprot:3520304-Pyramimonas_sp.AAC.1
MTATTARPACSWVGKSWRKPFHQSSVETTGTNQAGTPPVRLAKATARARSSIKTNSGGMQTTVSAMLDSAFVRDRLPSSIGRHLPDCQRQCRISGLQPPTPN